MARNKIGLYFQLESQDHGESLSMARMALNRLAQLEDEGVALHYFEMRYKDLVDSQRPKQIYIKLDGDERTFIEYEASSRWDEAFIKAFDRIHDQLRSYSTDYKIPQYA